MYTRAQESCSINTKWLGSHQDGEFRRGWLAAVWGSALSAGLSAGLCGTVIIVTAVFALFLRCARVVRRLARLWARLSCFCLLMCSLSLKTYHNPTPPTRPQQRGEPNNNLPLAQAAEPASTAPIQHLQFLGAHGFVVAGKLIPH